jgi:opacity protein-like surface antigen
MMKKLFILFFLISSSTASTTYAQSKGKLGFNFGYGGYPTNMGSIGLTYQASKQLALRPYIQFYIDKSNDESNQYEREDRYTNYGGAFSFLFTISSIEKYKIYWGASFSYFWLKNKWSSAYYSTFENNQYDNGESKGYRVSWGGLVGFQYAVGEKFCLYGEIGIGYSSSKQPNSYGLKSTSNQFGLNNSGLGFIFYIK